VQNRQKTTTARSPNTPPQLKKHPNDRTTQLALQRAKLRASQEHLTRARRLEATGKLDEALVEYELAAELNPGNGDIDAPCVTCGCSFAPVAGLTGRQNATRTLIDQSQKLGPAGLELPADVRLPASLSSAMPACVTSTPSSPASQM
jgi:hypothetical protein